MKRLILGGAAALLLLLVAVVVLVTLNLEPLINEQRETVAQIVTERLGRQVKFGPVKTTWQGGLGAEFGEIQLSAQDPAQPPMVTLEKIRLQVNLVKAITSLGKNVEVDAFVLHKPVIRLARDKDGHWNFEDIPKKLAETAPPAEPEPEEDTDEPKTAADFRGLRIAGVAITDGRVELDDAMLGRKLVVDAITLNVSEIVPGDDVVAKLALALVDGATRAPLDVEAALKPLPADLNFDPLPALAVKVHLGDLELGPWAALLPQGVMGPAAGKVGIDLQASATQGLETALAKGFVKVEGLVLAKGKVQGAKSDVRVDVDVDADLKKQRFDVNKLDVSGPAVSLQTRVNLVDKSIEGIKNANVELKVADLARVLAILPAGSGMLPKQLTLAGPFSVDLKGDADKAKLLVDLDKAHLAWEGAMDKGATTPLHLTVVANRAGDRVKLAPVELVLDTAKLTGSVDASTKPKQPMSGSLDTGPVVLADMKGLFPAFANALKRGDKVDGTVQLAATAKAVGDKQEAHALLTLKGMDVNLQSTKVKGDARIAADVAPQGNGTTTAGLDASLDGLSFKQLDENGVALAEKPLGMVLGLLVKVLYTGKDATVDQADLRVGKTLIAARGKAEGLDGASPTLDVKVDKLDVAFDDLRTLAPAAKALPAGGRLTGRVLFTGNPKVTKSMAAKLENLELTAAKNHVAGDIAVKDLDSPTVDVKLGTVDLNFDELRKLAQSDQIPPGGYLKCKVDVTGNVKKLSTLVANIDNLDANVYHSQLAGYAHVKNLDEPTFDVKLGADRLDLNEILKQTSGGKKEEPKEAKKDEEKPENEHGLPKKTRDMLKKVNGQADLKVGSLIYDKYDIKDFSGVVMVHNGVITLDRFELKIYDGKVTGTGTRVDTGGEWVQSKVALKVNGLDLRKAVDAHSEKKGAVSGKLAADVDVTAKGMSGNDIMNTLQGPVSISSDEVVLSQANLMESMTSSVTQSAPLVAKIMKKPSGPLAETKMMDLKGAGRFESGKVILAHPMTAKTPFGSVSMEGDIRFDSRLNLVGSATFTPDAITKMTAGKAKPKEPVTTPVKVGGTWYRPTVEAFDVGAFLKGAGLGDLMGAAAEAAEEARKQMEVQAAAAREQAEKAQKEAEARAAAEAAKMQDEAKKQADAARKQAEDAAKKQADEAKKQAEKQAADTKKKAEDEAKKQADEAKKKAEKALKGLFK